MKQFVDSIAKETVETELMQRLEGIFSPDIALDLPEENVEQIARETEDVKLHRESLQKQLAVLEKGVETCQHYERTKVQGKIGEKQAPVLK